MQPTSSQAAGGLPASPFLVQPRGIPVAVHRPLTFPPPTSSSSTSSSLTPSPGIPTGVRPIVRPQAAGITLGPVTPLRKRAREPLDPAATGAASAVRGDPSKFIDAFRTNLRTAALLPDGALKGLVRNLVTQRAGEQPLPRAELHLLMDVLVAERDAMTREAACQALQGLLDGLGAPAIAPGHLEVLVDRLVCMGFGDPGRCIQDELRTLTSALVQGPNRLDRLGPLVDLVMDNGTGLHRTRLGEAVAGVAQGLRTVSADADRMDTDLHERMLTRILRPTTERSPLHVRAALLALWENLTPAGQLTLALRNQVINQVFACREAAGARLLRSACALLTHILSRRDDDHAHRTALFATLVRESFWMSSEETREAALGVASGLGGSAMSTRTRAWLKGQVQRWQAIHADAGWSDLLAGLFGAGSPHAVQLDGKASPPRLQLQAKAMTPIEVESAAAVPQMPADPLQAASLHQAMDIEQDWTNKVARARQRRQDADHAFASGLRRGCRLEDLVPPRHQPDLLKALAENEPDA